MEFIALDVNVGDSFVLREGDNNFVIDGGKNKNTIAKKLLKNNIVDIDVAICSHYDNDHLNGIIGMINSNKINIKELWLPDIFGDIAFTLSRNPEFAFELLKRDRLSIQSEKELTLENYLENQETIEQNDMNGQVNIFDISVLEYLWDKLNRLSSCPLFEFNADNIKYIVNIQKIISLVIHATYSGSHIRWLKYKGTLTKKRISRYYDLFALNSYEKNLQVYVKDIFYHALYVLSKINKESLVFQFEKTGLPNVLFTADSDLGFCGKQYIQLNNNSVVTAPHHGSSANSCVYQIVQGNNLIYVRSDQVTNKRPCKEYISLPVKYCTVCNTDNHKQQVTLEYDQNKQLWVSVNTTYCSCQ
ncbi:MAG: hypothetical protein LBC76_10260 [Treponema sp.]|jgi:hypothetical protein|nr:hypothetical protein [Treponema sp.]